MFLTTYAALWLACFWWIEWTETTHLLVLAAAMVGSSIVSLVVLRNLRQSLSTDVLDRATRMHDAVNATESERRG